MKQAYTIIELKLIAKTLNTLLKRSNQTNGVEMNTWHFSRFYNDTHYIDFHEVKRKCGVYKKYKHWSKMNEILR